MRTRLDSIDNDDNRSQGSFFSFHGNFMHTDEWLVERRTTDSLLRRRRGQRVRRPIAGHGQSEDADLPAPLHQHVRLLPRHLPRGRTARPLRRHGALAGGQHRRELGPLRRLRRLPEGRRLGRRRSRNSTTSFNAKDQRLGPGDYCHRTVPEVAFLS